MATTDTKPGFRLPWASDRGEADPDSAPVDATNQSGDPVAEETDAAAMIDVEPATADQVETTGTADFEPAQTESPSASADPAVESARGRTLCGRGLPARTPGTRSRASSWPIDQGQRATAEPLVPRPWALLRGGQAASERPRDAAENRGLRRNADTTSPPSATGQRGRWPGSARRPRPDPGAERPRASSDRTPASSSAASSACPPPWPPSSRRCRVFERPSPRTMGPPRPWPADAGRRPHGSTPRSRPSQATAAPRRRPRRPSRPSPRPGPAADDAAATAETIGHETTPQPRRPRRPSGRRPATVDAGPARLRRRRGRGANVGRRGRVANE